MTDMQKDFFMNFVNRYQDHIPEAKDIMRAETCKDLAGAYRQLKAIKDTNKFFRRLKAFLSHGFKITNFSNTQFEYLNCDELSQWLVSVQQVYESKPDPVITNKKIMRLANILTI